MPSGCRALRVAAQSVHVNACWTGAHSLNERSRVDHVCPSVGAAAAAQARRPSHQGVWTKQDAMARSPLCPPLLEPPTPTLPSWSPQTPTLISWNPQVPTLPFCCSQAPATPLSQLIGWSAHSLGSRNVPYKLRTTLLEMN